MKKAIAIGLAAALTAAYTLPVFAANFSDIGDYAWAKDAINNMADKKYITGYDDGTFRPAVSVTRLEGYALFARAMGAKSESNKDILELAHKQYDETIASCGLTWGEDEIVYLLYKGVLRTSDLDIFVKGNQKNVEMPRYEAAVIIAKAMGADSELSSDLGVSLKYSDAASIPKTALKYVEYVSNKGIMKGNEDNTFAPLKTVSRAEMAVMLDRAVEIMSKSQTMTGKVIAVHSDTKTIEMKETDGSKREYLYSDTCKVYKDATPMEINEIQSGSKVVFTMSNGKIQEITVLDVIPDETFWATFKANVTSNGAMTLSLLKDGEKEVKNYECASDIIILLDGTPTTIRSFTSGDYMKITVEDGVITIIEGEAKEKTISNARVDSVDILDDGTVTMTIEHSLDEYNQKTYIVDSKAEVIKDDKDSTLDKVYRGDTVKLTLKYGKVTKVIAESSTKVVEGTISELTISASGKSKITVKTGGTETVYDIPNGVVIEKDGKTDATLYDFRVGDAVKITIESKAVVKIAASVSQLTEEGRVYGTVTAVNTSYGFIKVMQDNGNEETVYCKDATSKIMDMDGKTILMKNLEIGSTVSVVGNISNGAFIGKIIIVNSAK